MSHDLDVKPYVDLTLEDVDAITIAERAVTDAGTKLPDWEPREGSTELAILEGMALEADELIFAVNRLPGAVTEVLLRLFALDRDPGLPATATVTFTLADTTGHTIPAGTRLLLDLGTVDPVELLTDVDLVIAGGLDTGTVAVTADGTPVDEANGTPAGTALELLDAVPYVETTELATDLIGGRDPEDGPAFLERGIVRLSRLVTTLVLPEHFTAAALEEPYVDRASTVDRYDPGQVPPENRNGHVTVAVSGPAGAAVSGPNKVALESLLEAAALASLDVHIADATVTAVDIDVTVTSTGALLDPDLEAAVLDALDAYLDPEVWPFAGTVYRNELIALVDNVAGVDRVVTLTLNSGTADVVIGGVGPLANLGAGSTVGVV